MPELIVGRLRPSLRSEASGRGTSRSAFSVLLSYVGDELVARAP